MTYMKWFSGYLVRLRIQQNTAKVYLFESYMSVFTQNYVVSQNLLFGLVDKGLSRY